MQLKTIWKNYSIVIFCSLAFSCQQEESAQTLGGFTYLPVKMDCQDSSINYWLVDMMVKTESDSVLFTTFDKANKLELKRRVIRKESSLVHLLEGLCVGQTLELNSRADSLYLGLGGKLPLNLKAEDKLIATVALRDKLSERSYIANKLAFEKQSTERYLEQFSWDAQYDSLTRIFYEKTKQAPNNPKVNQRAKLNYSIESITGRPVTKNKPENPLLFDKADKNILKGIHFLVDHLREGEKVRAILPSDQAFGPDGNSKVGGFNPIVIELEVVSLED